MRVGEICNRDVIVTRPETSISETARLMRERHVGSVVLVKDNGSLPIPVGIVTDRDLVVEVLAQGVDADRVTAGDLMSTDLVALEEDTDVWGALQRMRAAGVRRAPVVNAEERLVGILAVDDLLEFCVEELGALVKLIQREQTREEATRSQP